MKEIEPDGEHSRMRRLPKRPHIDFRNGLGSSAASPVAPGANVVAEGASGATGRERYYFETLPDPDEMQIPSADDLAGPETSGHLPKDVSRDTEEFPADQAFAETESVLAEETETPISETAPERLLFQYIAEPEQSAVPQRDERPVSVDREGAALPAAPPEPETRVKQQAFPVRSGTVEPARPVSDAPRPAARKEIDDPKPASARPSGVVRSRPQRPSGMFALARASGETNAARPSGSFPVGRAPVSSRRPAAEAVSGGPSQTSAIGEPLRLGAIRTEKPVGRLEAAASSSPGESASDQPQPSSPPARAATKGRTGSVIAMFVASAVLIGYAFEIGTLQGEADALAARLVSGGAGGAQAVAGILPWLLALPAIALFGYIVWLLAAIIGLRRTGKRRNRDCKTRRAKSPAQIFKNAASRYDVGPRTAFRAWKLLEAACGKDAALSMDASLSGDLAISAKEVRALHLDLLRETSRVSDPAMRLPAVETVLDLLRAVEDAPAIPTERNSGEMALPGDPGQRKKPIRNS